MGGLLYTRLPLGTVSLWLRRCSAKADVNATTDDGNTALNYSANHNEKPLTELLIANAADLNIQDRNGNTALHRAACNSHTNVVTVLGIAGADLGIKNKFERTALDFANKNNDTNTITLLQALAQPPPAARAPIG